MHCAICHGDYPENSYHGCGGTPTPCRSSCRENKSDLSAARRALADFERRGGTTLEALKRELGL